MIRVTPFGAFEGFSDQPRAGSSYYTQGLTKSLLGAATLYAVKNKRDSTQVAGMGNIKYFAKANGVLYAQDDAGNILKEQTPGVYDFTIVRSPGGNGAGLVGDQFNNLLYAQNTALGLYNGSFTDSLQSLTAGQHPMDTFEDLRVIGNVSTVAVLFSDNSWNASAFTLPSGMSISALRSGPTGILIGANFGYQGALILWDGNSIRSKTSWKWTNGQIISIDKYGENWIVKTQREVLITNGYTVRQVFGVFDDPLSFRSYDILTTNTAQQILVVNDVIVFANPYHSGGPLSYEFGKMKPGLYLYHLSTHTWDYIPVATGNTAFLTVNAVFSDISFNNRILVSYRDNATAVNYIATLTTGASTSATYISEPLGIGRPHFQRVFFGPTEKVAQALILNLGVLTSITDQATESFDVSLKIYNFKRQLWGYQVTNASLTNKNQLQVDGTVGLAVAQVGDEVTILGGVNASKVAHITAIANGGTNTETWTLNTTFASQTESNIHVNVQPFIFIEKKSFSNLSQLKNIYFNITQEPRGKQFLAKLLIENIGSNLQVEIQTSYFVFDDLGYDSAT